VSSVRYELGFYIPKDDSLHSHRRENLNSYTVGVVAGVRRQTSSIYWPQLCRLQAPNRCLMPRIVTVTVACSYHRHKPVGPVYQLSLMARGSQGIQSVAGR
jgi:hypothetical protein